MSGCIALVVGAGRGHRFGGELPKQYARVGGKSVIGLSLQAFAGHPGIDAVRAVIHPDDRHLYDEATQSVSDGLLEPVNGGASRQESVRLGLESLSDSSPDMVLIHDAARPFVDSDVIDRVIASLQTANGAIPALPVNDTLKRGAKRTITTTVDRADLWRAQTPQGFRYSEILKAHGDSASLELTDDASVAEHAGIAVELVDGSENNVKLTTQDDLVRAERLLGGGETRTGFGFDVHRFTDGDSVTLCGVNIPHSASLDGHSDADVGLHALTDALLGCVGEGDIGSHFPPSEAEWRGASSDVFLKKAVDIVASKGGVIVNVDVTLICEEPKVGPHRSAMRDSIAAILGVEVGRVSVKATTTERLGFTGRKEGIAAQSVATVRV
ncbi:MAG: bifunctional 2-C-methyl-D-erythritol 4-phosphate cytidylyltransferase/2-C-methyl-D-erythritol 2,4-cyclodiphosphate synthase [Rhodospirillaceae bacterium]|jgi:2-C-methyl-D-erythritol 4-phosphate cytidylyltransferase / 2-C-methyl-D-erythritol 2,4-cyclodiphosphate synthase|nr:bifunctional 2-C-methyl-D-erythritol 4-phosphate cytidylyltransferase/2-C-methyl-D-erythritol 2,4-cyclodiphosphate synthase [Rhodospirillaceae bacterium]MBT4220360.1 bifunctional 2-C-methyl-D-erythritol 4-phosphate cytidylyltransferase/2-C-methyl-D-erythritol 2,4-cyclodiphosphate synthase [Rhodospirillaceae bacterium]MBT5014127.1 bifunctional 2-C-methyl-D-erythritol 4-phosphate cytidylyltransferase/2-C-methyl-D-erythritol 2,4-cyclodiphosphate synthase [Rhodospirillaceae bacterium]MBT5309292.1